MDATLTEEEEFLAENAARVAADLRKLAGAANRLEPDSAWAALDAAGLVAMRSEADPEERASAVAVALCIEAFGAQASPAPLLGPLLAVELCRLAGADVGDRRLTVALGHGLGDIARLGAVDTVAFDALGATGAVGLTADGHPGSVALGAGAGSVEIGEVGEGAGSADLTRLVVPLGVGGDHEALGAALDADTLTRWRAFALAAVCADAVGTMAGSLAMAAEYARNRRQYGRPIGSFQAVQHLAAESYVSVEASRSVTYWAAWAVDALEPAEALRAATVAKAYVARVCRPVVESVLQVHGGIGQTWEHDCHRYLRRALVDRAVLGDELHHEAVLATEALADPGAA